VAASALLKIDVDRSIAGEKTLPRMPANPDEIAPSVFYLRSDAPDSDDTAFVRLMVVLN
jgi:hypothetical protein